MKAIDIWHMFRSSLDRPLFFPRPKYFATRLYEQSPTQEQPRQASSDPNPDFNKPAGESADAMRARLYRFHKPISIQHFYDLYRDPDMKPPKREAVRDRGRA